MNLLDLVNEIERKIHLPSIVQGEYAENELRKDFTTSERVAIAKAVEEEIGDRRGINQYSVQEDCQNFAEANNKRKDEIAAQKISFIEWDFDPYVPGWMPKSIEQYQQYSSSAKIYLCEFCSILKSNNCKHDAPIPNKWKRCREYRFSGKYKKVFINCQL